MVTLLVKRRRRISRKQELLSGDQDALIKASSEEEYKV